MESRCHDISCRDIKRNMERKEKRDVATQRQRNAIGTQRERDGNATEGIEFNVTFNSLTQRTYRHGVQRKHTMLETHYDASAMKCRPWSEDRKVGIRFSFSSFDRKSVVKYMRVLNTRLEQNAN